MVEVTRRELLRAGGGALGAITLLPVLGACGGSDSSTPGPKRGGRLRAGFAGSGESESLNPLLPVPTSDFARSVSIFESLTLFPAGPGQDVHLQLARSMEPDAEATRWRVTLREGVMWHDGKPLTANDVLSSIETVLDPKQSAQWLSYLKVLDFKRCKVVGSGALDLVCKTPTLDLPLRLAGMPILQAGVTQFKKTAVGTGPFKLVSFTPGEGSRLERNEDWWDASGGPFLDEVELRSIPDNTARINAFKSGDLDYVTDLTYPQYAQLQKASGTKLTRIPAANVPVFKMRCDKPPFDDVLVRQAFRLIPDREQMLKTVLVGFGTVANDAFGENLPDYKSTLKAPPHDPEGARKLLAQAGKAGLEVTLHASDAYTGSLESSHLFAQNAKDAGVKVNVDNVPGDQMYNPIDRYLEWEFASAVLNQNLPIAALIPGIYLSDTGFNDTGWFRKDFDAKFRRAVTTADPAVRKRLLDEIQVELHEESGHLIPIRGDAVIATSARVSGIKGLPFYRKDGEGDFSKVSLG